MCHVRPIPGDLRPLGLALVYRFAPNRVRPFRLVTCGTVAATVLMIAASVALSLYTSNFANYSAVYGSIGAVIVLMLSLFVSGLVVLVGAEVDSVLERASTIRHSRAGAPGETAINGSGDTTEPKPWTAAPRRPT